MPAVVLLVFREVLEAALIISVVCAATRGVPRRGAFVIAGIMLGITGAVVVALGADLIANLAGGAGQDVFNAAVLMLAVGMIGWHVVWMSSHGRELTKHMQEVGVAVKEGSRALSVLLTVVALAVLREGSEVVLFLYGMAAGGIGTAGLIIGVALGIGGGSLLGIVLYFGLLRIPLKYFFSVTNAMLILLAAGLASTAAGFLVQSDLLPSWGSPVWNTTRILADDSVLGKTLGVLVGYKAAPAGIQIIFYLATLALLIGGMLWQQRRTAANGRGTASAAAIAAAAAVCLSMLCHPRAARADDFIVYSPYVMASQSEIELRGYQNADARADHGGSAAALSVAHAVNSWWKPEIYLVKYQHSPTDGGRNVGREFENTFQLTDAGKYWADLGFLVSYDHKILKDTPSAIEFGPLIGKTSGRFAHFLNLIWEKQVGAGADAKYQLRTTYSGTYALSQALRPGVEAYIRPGDHAYQVGPITRGEWRVPGTNGNFEYRVGVVFGVNSDAPQLTWLALVAYEFL